MSDHRTQYLALFLIALAAVCIGVGEQHNWRDLIGFSLTFGGAGCGILTGQRLSNVTNKDGGTINVDQSAEPKP